MLGDWYACGRLHCRRQSKNCSYFYSCASCCGALLLAACLHSRCPFRNHLADDEDDCERGVARLQSSLCNTIATKAMITKRTTAATFRAFSAGEDHWVFIFINFANSLGGYRPPLSSRNIRDLTSTFPVTNRIIANAAIEILFSWHA